ncbi:Copper-transporting ATPase 1 [Frankliniella fusca]|uniref:Copper-transporting ATPase 1 n=1 Tax=Frankliniella fusca TaxID=407009 RepID=A0AAE1HXR7_9NEOP|nr:Copper-transporting ATPase 1 [Frankliniella fusca]
MASLDESCTITIEGMTCQSCVNSIESNICKVNGVKGIKVNLEKKEAIVGIDKMSNLSPLKVAELISDMGFDAKPAISTSSSGVSTMTKDSSQGPEYCETYEEESALISGNPDPVIHPAQPSRNIFGSRISSNVYSNDLWQVL